MLHTSTVNSAHTRVLADRLIASPIGEVVTYEMLSDAIKEDVRKRRYLLMGAILIANREAGAIFGNVHGVGYMRRAPGDAHLIGNVIRHRVRRASGRGLKIMGNALQKGNDISDEQRRQAFSEQVALGLIHHQTFSRNMVKVKEGQPVPDLSKIIVSSLAAHREATGS